jgi:hypothetical protein
VVADTMNQAVVVFLIAALVGLAVALCYWSR